MLQNSCQTLNSDFLREKPSKKTFLAIFRHYASYNIGLPCQKRSFARKADTIRFCQAGLTQQKYSTACESIDSLDNERGVLLHSIH